MSQGGRIARVHVQRVHLMPKTLQPGILYVSQEYGTAAHLCACGCGAKVRTPLGPTAWSIEETPRGATLHPSVGNWQKPCRSHYLIIRGEVIWADQWTSEQIAAGRRFEDERRQVYYEGLSGAQEGPIRKFLRWLMSLFGK